MLKVVNSHNIFAGPDEDSLFPIKQRELENYGDPIALFTGNLEVRWRARRRTNRWLSSSRVDPTPFHIAAILAEPSVRDDASQSRSGFASPYRAASAQSQGHRQTRM
jgi:hypothetical protein